MFLKPICDYKQSRGQLLQKRICLVEVAFSIVLFDNKQYMSSDVPTTDAARIAAIIKQRQTFKVLAGSPANQAIAETTDLLTEEQRIAADAQVIQAIRDAGWAPFHYDRAADGMAVPWRVEWLPQAKCHEVAANFFQWFDVVKPNNKLPSMLNACGSLVLVSWLPQFTDQNSATSSLTCLLYTSPSPRD